MASQQALALWKSQISSYDRIIHRCCNRLLTPLTRFLPSDFQQRIQSCREALQIKQPDNYEEHLDVIVQNIEGKKNLSGMQLAELLVRELGGTHKYWQNVIIDVAELSIYTNDLTIWHVRKIFEDKLYIDAENLSNYRRLCKTTKNYLNALANLIKAITKFDIKKDSLSRLDDLFKKVKLAEEKYVGFSQQMQGLEASCTMDQVSNNISQKSKQNALKGFYNFNQPAKVDKCQKTRNTLFNYNFKMKNKQVPKQRVSGPTKNVKQTNKAIVGLRLEEFQKVMKNIRINQNDNIIQELKIEFISSKKQKIYPLAQYPQNYTTIWDKDYFFSYITHPIDMAKFNQFITPFQRHHNINYQINSEDEYQDLIGEDVDGNTEMSSVSELSKNSFIVSDHYVSDDQNLQAVEKEVEYKKTNLFGDRWSFQRKTQFVHVLNCNKNIFTMMLIQPKLRLPLPVVQKDQIQEVLYRVVDGKDRESISDALSKQKIKITKPKLKQFLQKKCKAITISQNPTKIIYKIIEYQDQSEEDQKQNLSKKCCGYVPTVQELNQKDDDAEDTNLYEPQYFSQVIESNGRMKTREYLKKQRSLKLQNNSNRNSRGEIRRRSSNRMSTRSKDNAAQK